MNQEIEVSQSITAPLDLIWRACASPRGLASWQADEAEGEARLGGTLTLYWVAFGAKVELNVIDLVPYQRMVLRHGESVVEFRFDHNLVTLVHRGLTSEDDAEGLASSWRIALAQLAHCVERHPGRQRRVHWMVRSVRATPESVYLCYTDPNLLTLWLTSSGGVPQEGEAYEMWLKSGQHITGQVLAHVPGRDIVLRCDNLDDAVLTLRTLPSPRSEQERLLALVWSEWGAPSGPAEQLGQDLEAAADRLVTLLSSHGEA